MIRKTLYLFAGLTLLLSFFAITSGDVHAKSSVNETISSTAPVDFTVIQKSCAVVTIHLDGPRHTITCTQAHRLSVTNLNQGNCTVQDDLEVDNYNYTGRLCFGGWGYLGVKIYQVNAVFNNVSFTSSWIRYYHPAGVTCSINAGVFGGNKIFGNGNTNVTVTQLDWDQGDNGPEC